MLAPGTLLMNHGEGRTLVPFTQYALDPPLKLDRIEKVVEMRDPRRVPLRVVPEHLEEGTHISKSRSLCTEQREESVA